MSFRTEKDPLGEKQVPADALYGIQTLRAVENYPISGLRPLAGFVEAVVMIKRSAAVTHKHTGRLEVLPTLTPSSRPPTRSSPGSTATSSWSIRIRPAPAPRTT